jgi:hypothetical protein
MQDLRKSGEIVVQVFADELADHDEFVFDRELLNRNGQWAVEKV